LSSSEFRALSMLQWMFFFMRNKLKMFGILLKLSYIVFMIVSAYHTVMYARMQTEIELIGKRIQHVKTKTERMDKRIEFLYGKASKK
jgi:hypothetical protein